ncbi:MAG: hypothetical protein WDN09_01800 [bacterium]
MKSSQPIVTKDAGTATEVAVSGIYTGPCKPPYLCDFAWDVQAIAKSGAVSRHERTEHLQRHRAGSLH